MTVNGFRACCPPSPPFASKVLKLHWLGCNCLQRCTARMYNTQSHGCLVQGCAQLYMVVGKSRYVELSEIVTGQSNVGTRLLFVFFATGRTNRIETSTLFSLCIIYFAHCATSRLSSQPQLQPRCNNPVFKSEVHTAR